MKRILTGPRHAGQEGEDVRKVARMVGRLLSTICEEIVSKDDRNRGPVPLLPAGAVGCSFRDGDEDVPSAAVVEFGKIKDGSVCSNPVI